MDSSAETTLAPWACGRVFIIAEAGSNWRMGTPERDRKMARELIDVAAEAGCDAVKFQVYRPETVYVANAGQSDYLSDAGIRAPIVEVFRDLAMPYEMLDELADYCGTRRVAFMATAFSVADAAAVDRHVGVHKIASYEISHLRLIECVGATGKPVVLSTGASAPDDIETALAWLRDAGAGPVCLMQCTAKYPAPVASLNLMALPALAAQFGCPVGLSDHSRDPVLAPTMAVALGAVVIEKHYTLSNRLPGPDHAFALEPHELRRMVQAIRDAEAARGPGVKEILPDEEELYAFARRGLQATRNIAAGELLQEGINVDILRPGKQHGGLHPRFLARIEGRTATRDIPVGDGITEGDYA